MLQYQREILKQALKILMCPPFQKSSTTMIPTFRGNNISEPTQQLYQRDLAPAVAIIIFILLILQLNCRVKLNLFQAVAFFHSHQKFIDNFRCSTMKADRLDIISVAPILCKRKDFMKSHRSSITTLITYLKK